MKVKIRNRIPERYYHESKLSTDFPRELNDFFTLETSESLKDYLYHLRTYMQMGTSFIFEKIINLEHSVLDHQELSVLFAKWNFYRELVKFNMFYRLVNLMEKLEIDKLNGYFFISIGSKVVVYYKSSNSSEETNISIKLLEIEEVDTSINSNVFLKFVFADENINTDGIKNEYVSSLIAAFNSCIVSEVKKDVLQNKPCSLFTVEKTMDSKGWIL